MDNSASDQSEYSIAVRSYLMACVEFCSANHGGVRKLLSQSNALGQDKEGWNIGVRILAIINAIDQNDHDFSDSLIVNLRQFVREGLQGAALSVRDEKILELLLQLRKESYDFKKVYKTKLATVQLLFSREAHLAWHVQTPELICFHTWFMARVKGQSYIPDYREDSVYHFKQ